MSEGEDQWVTVGIAAERSGLTTATVRQLCRSGTVPSRRRNGSNGPYLVSLGAVLSHAAETSEEMDAVYWEDEAQRSRAEAAALRAELNRLRARCDELQAELERTRTAGAELRPELEALPEVGYRGPVRQQFSQPPLPDLNEQAEASVEPGSVAPVAADQVSTHTVETTTSPFDDSVLPAEDRRRRGLRRRRAAD